MTAFEKKQKLVEKIQQVPDQYVDDVDNLLDQILTTERQRKERFEKLLAETSEKYKEVWKALA